MKPRWRLTLFALAALASLRCGIVTAASEEPGPPLKQGDVVRLGGRRAVLTKLDVLPYVESDYTRRFRFDTCDNPKLKELRERYRLDEVVAPGKDEFDRQILLLDWVNHRFKKFGQPTSPARGALDILKAIDAGNAFFCSHYGDVMVSAAASLGWIDRPHSADMPGRWQPTGRSPGCISRDLRACRTSPDRYRAHLG